jgi:hypothetical protein
MGELGRAWSPPENGKAGTGSWPCCWKSTGKSGGKMEEIPLLGKEKMWREKMWGKKTFGAVLFG